MTFARTNVAGDPVALANRPNEMTLNRPENRWLMAKRVYDRVTDLIARVLVVPDGDDADRLAEQMIEALEDHRHVLTMIWTDPVCSNFFVVSMFACVQPPNNSSRQAVQDALAQKNNITSTHKVHPSLVDINLDESVVSEALILSDLFRIDECDAVHLLIAGEIEQTNFPSLARGLCAVLAYYSHHAYVARTWQGEHACTVTPTICFVALSRMHGLRYTPHARSALAHVDERIVQEWLSGNGGWQLYRRLVDVSLTLSVDTELDRLGAPAVKGLGGGEHRWLCVDMIHTIQESLSDTLVQRAYRCGASLPEMQSLVTALRTCTFSTAAALCASEMNVIMALLWAIDTSLIGPLETEEDISAYHPFTGFITDVNELFTGVGTQWAHGNLYALVLFAWAVSVRSMALHHVAHAMLESLNVDDEDMIDSSLDGRALHWLRVAFATHVDARATAIIGTCETVPLGEYVYWRREPALQLRLHNLLAQFISGWPIRLKQMRSEADDEVRCAQEAVILGQTPPASVLHFEQLLLLVADVYAADPLRMVLADEYWHQWTAGSDGNESMVSGGPQPTALFKFVRHCAIDQHALAVVHVAYIKMVTALCATPYACTALVQLLSNAQQQQQSGGGGGGGALSLMHFFAALRQYAHVYSQQQNATASTASSHSQVKTLFGMRAHRYAPSTMPGAVSLSNKVQISREELEGLLSWLALIERIASLDAQSASDMAVAQLAFLPSAGTLLHASTPTALKVGLLRAITALVRTGSGGVREHAWQLVVHAQLITFPDTTTGVRAVDGGFKRELDEVESRLEMYDLTAAALDLIDALFEQDRKGGLSSSNGADMYDAQQMDLLHAVCLQYICDDVFTKCLQRPYKRSAQMVSACARAHMSTYEQWSIAARCLHILHGVLASGKLSSGVGENGCTSTLMCSLLTDGPLLRTVLNVLERALSVFDTYTVGGSDGDASLSTYACTTAVYGALRVLHACSARQVELAQLLRAGVSDEKSLLTFTPLFKLFLQYDLSAQQQHQMRSATDVNDKQKPMAITNTIACIIGHVLAGSRQWLWASRLLRHLCSVHTQQIHVARQMAFDAHVRRRLMTQWARACDNTAVDFTSEDVNVDEEKTLLFNQYDFDDYAIPSSNTDSDSRTRRLTCECLFDLLFETLKMHQMTLGDDCVASRRIGASLTMASNTCVAHIIMINDVHVAGDVGNRVGRRREIELHNPGVENWPFTCVHAALQCVLRELCERRVLTNGGTSARRDARLAEAALRVVTQMIVNTDTRFMTLRYVNGAHNLLDQVLIDVLVPWCSVNDELAHGLNEEATGDDQQQTRVSSAVDVRVCALCVRMLAIDMYTHVSAGDWRRVRRVLDALTVQDITTQSSSSTASTAVVHENDGVDTILHRTLNVRDNPSDVGSSTSYMRIGVSKLFGRNGEHELHNLTHASTNIHSLLDKRDRTSDVKDVQSRVQGTGDARRRSQLMHQLLAHIHFTMPDLCPTRLDCFSRPRLEQVMRACCSTAGQTNTSATSVTLQCDIVQLHACLEHEVHTLLAHVRAGGTHEQQPTMASVNEQVVVTEMRRVLQHAVEYNRLIEISTAMQLLFRSWHSLLKIVVNVQRQLLLATDTSTVGGENGADVRAHVRFASDLIDELLAKTRVDVCTPAAIVNIAHSVHTLVSLVVDVHENTTSPTLVVDTGDLRALITSAVPQLATFLTASGTSTAETRTQVYRVLMLFIRLCRPSATQLHELIWAELSECGRALIVNCVRDSVETKLAECKISAHQLLSLLCAGSGALADMCVYEVQGVERVFNALVNVDDALLTQLFTGDGGIGQQRLSDQQRTAGYQAVAVSVTRMSALASVCARSAAGVHALHECNEAERLVGMSVWRLSPDLASCGAAPTPLVCMYVRLLMETFTLIGVISRHSEEVTTTVYEMLIAFLQSQSPVLMYLLRQFPPASSVHRFRVDPTAVLSVGGEQACTSLTWALLAQVLMQSLVTFIVQSRTAYRRYAWRTIYNKQRTQQEDVRVNSAELAARVPLPGADDRCVRAVTEWVDAHMAAASAQGNGAVDSVVPSSVPPSMKFDTDRIVLRPFV